MILETHSWKCPISHKPCFIKESPPWRWIAEQVLPSSQPSFPASDFPGFYSSTQPMTTTWLESSLATRTIKTSTLSHPQWPDRDRFGIMREPASKEEEKTFPPGLLEADQDPVSHWPPLNGAAGEKCCTIWLLAFNWIPPHAARHLRSWQQKQQVSPRTDADFVATPKSRLEGDPIWICKSFRLDWIRYYHHPANKYRIYIWNM